MEENPEYAETLERAMENRRSMTYSYNEVAGWFGMTLRVRKAACDTRDHLVENGCSLMRMYLLLKNISTNMALET